MDTAPEILNASHWQEIWDAGERLARRGPQHADAETHHLWQLGVGALADHDFEQARRLFLSTIERDPLCTDAYLGLLIAARSEGRSTIDCFELSLALAQVGAGLGVEQASSGLTLSHDYTALSAYRQPITTPDDARLALVSIAVAMKNLVLAGNWLGRLDDPNNPVALILEGKLHLASEDYNEALGSFAASLPLASEAQACDVRLGLGLAHAGIAGDESYAHRELALALRLSPDAQTSLVIHHALGKLLARSNELDEALFHFNAALQIQPDHQGLRASSEMARRQQASRDDWQWDVSWRLIELDWDAAVEAEAALDQTLEEITEREPWDFGSRDS
jgi:tetratricopeptide (TPR) repeat protein